MRNLWRVFAAVLWWLAFSLCACEKEEAIFCDDDLQLAGTAKVSDGVAIAIPARTFVGLGTLPVSVTVGDYEGKMSSVVTRYTQVEEGIVAELIHFFDDGKGNTFWVHDPTFLTPVDMTMRRFTFANEMTVVEGTGYFRCAYGSLTKEGQVNFATATLDFFITGTLCTGCDNPARRPYHRYDPR
jgi:hypothetical protein